MFTAIKMPKLSDTSDEYKIIKIRRAVGDEVQQGEIFADAETDKGSFEVAFYTSGKITEIIAKEGDVVRENAMLGVLDDRK